MTGVYHDEEDVRQMGPGDTGWNADLILWRLYLRDAERELEEVLARYPNDAQRIEEAERGVRHSREVVDGFEWLIDPDPGPWPSTGTALVQDRLAADDDSFCVADPVIDMTTGPQQQVTRTGGRNPRVKVTASGSHRTTEDQKHQVMVLIGIRDKRIGRPIPGLGGSKAGFRCE